MLPDVKDRYSEQDVADFYRSGYWTKDTSTSIADKWAHDAPNKVFMSDDTGEITFLELKNKSLALASELVRLGVVRGERVLVQLPNWREFAVIAQAVSRVGAVIVPILPIYRDAEVEYICGHSGARVAFCPNSFKQFDHVAMFERIRVSTPSLVHVVPVRGSEGGYRGGPTYESIQAAPAGNELAVAAGNADDGHVIIYTSGTESKPKGCFHTYNTVAFSVRASLNAHRWTDSDVAFGPSPLSHSTGYIMSYLTPLHAGARSHVMERWTPGAGNRVVEKERCTITTTATAFLRMSLDSYRHEPVDMSSMRVWIAAGSPIPEQVINEAREVIPSCEVLSHYGRSENQFTTTCAVGVNADRVLKSDGAPLPGVETVILSEDGKPLPVGETGDIGYRGPGHMLAYFGEPVRTAELFTVNGFSRSGDLGSMDEFGYLRVSGRLKDIVIRGGMNISAREIEEHMYRHPDVSDVAIVAMPDEKLGERVCAYVVLVEGTELTLDGLSTYLKHDCRVAIQKLPERLEIVRRLPMTASGKIKKFELREDVACKLKLESNSK
ncbi:AMP-binding protein [Rhodococcus sp. LB1]|uniref:AMP-binding protein n=1 Tax=Rhodococcus sp. LB1 TaxID=1807499 RepID=UPI0007950D5C|nr:AMP-binding protein [Rhodococcus sp. LB1]KXX55406.1 hypothetical protein AZG88_02590 [Rhodococcus sp. LB1]